MATTLWSPPVIVRLDHRTSVGRQCTCAQYTHPHPALYECRTRAYVPVLDGGPLGDGVGEVWICTNLPGRQQSSWKCATGLLKVMHDPRWKGGCRLLGDSPWVSMIVAAHSAATPD